MAERRGGWNTEHCCSGIINYLARVGVARWVWPSEND